MKKKWAFLALATTLFCTIALPGYGQLPKVSVDRVNRADLMKQARAKVDSKAWPDAEGMYDQAIALAPEDPEAWLMRGFVRAVQGNFEDALSDDNAFLVAAALPGGDTRSRAIGYANRADIWNRKKEPLRALLDSVDACAIDPTFARAWLARADAQFALGNLTEANACIEKARPLQGFTPRSYSAEEARQNALRYKPLNDTADFSQAFPAAAGAAETGQWYKAITAYSIMIAIKPLNGDAWGNRGILHWKLEDDADAIADYSSALSAYELVGDTGGQARNLLNRAIALSRQSRLREAINDVTLAARLSPGDTRAAAMLESFRRKLAETPAETLSFLARAKSLIEQAKAFNGGIFDHNTANEKVIALLDSTTKEQPGNAQAWYLRGRAEEAAFHILGSNQKAVPFYDKAIALDPRFADAYFRRGNVLLDQLSVPPKEREKGWADRDQAISLGIRNAKLFADRAGERKIIHRDFDGALEDIDKALAMEPKNTEYLKLRDEIVKGKTK